MNDQLEMSLEQRRQLGRAKSRISTAIIEFFGARERGTQFCGDELREFVAKQIGPIAPGSPDRVMRDLRADKLINYRLINRRKSLYEVA